MTEPKQKWNPKTPSRWYVATASLALSGLAICIASLYAFQHWRVPWNSDMMYRLEWMRTIAGVIAFVFGVWAMRYLPSLFRLGVLAVALLALAMCLVAM